MTQSNEEMITELQSALQDSSLSKAEFIRVQAVLLRKKRQKRSLIATLVGKSHSSVEDWITLYHNNGLEGLRTKKREISPRGQLSNAQRRRIYEQLNQTPREVGIAEEDYWHMSLVKKLVERETTVVYTSDNSYRRLLKEAGLSYQKVAFVDNHQSQESHDAFKKQFEAKIKKGAITMWW